MLQVARILQNAYKINKKKAHTGGFLEENPFPLVCCLVFLIIVSVFS